VGKFGEFSPYLSSKFVYLKPVVAVCVCGGAVVVEAVVGAVGGDSDGFPVGVGLCRASGW
jgi:hypothetical protein